MENNEKMNSNFIHDIIDEGIESGVTSKIRTRFPPEPNGYLHIGHAKSICLNFGTAKKYKGKCNLRFDDTNPVKEDVEYVESIKEDIEWLGFKWDKLLYASEYFEKIYRITIKLIKQGDAYVCDLSADEIRDTRGTLSEPGNNSPYRNRTVKENLQLFDDMKNGKCKEGERVLRAKIDMSSPNINMRDPVLYRVLYRTHHNTGDRWCIYPMYDYAHPLSDAIEGITHSICTLEFEDHRPLYDWAVLRCGLKAKPRQIEFARLNIDNTVMSKRFLKKLVDDKLVDGWSDPRMPTLCGLRKRGIPPEAIRDFCGRVGVAKANSSVDPELLNFCARNALNASAQRAMSVLKPLKAIITNYPAGLNETLPFEMNPADGKNKTRDITFSNEIYIDADDFSLNPPPKYHRLTKGGSVRLKSAYIIECADVETDADGNPVLLKCKYVENSRSGSDTSGMKVKGVVQFVNAKDCVEIKIKKYGALLDPDKSEGDFTERLNDRSLEVITALAEPYLEQAGDRTSFQFLRTGYYVKDKDYFIEITGLKDNFNK